MDFKEVWLDQLIAKLKMSYPDESEKRIVEFANRVYERDFKDTKCIIYNNYEKDDIDTTLSKTINWVNSVKPILTESGTIFKHHEECFNPDTEILQSKLDGRSLAKKEMFKYKKLANDETDPKLKAEYLYKAKSKDLEQKRNKVISNSEYGASGLKSSWFFNIAVSTATTSRGQALISTSCCAFEDFLGDNIKFMNMDECLSFINNIILEKKSREKSDNKWVNSKNTEEVVERLKSKFFDEDICDTKLITKIIRNLSQEDKNRIYYKSNLYKFIENSSKTQYLLSKIINADVEFKDCNKVPDELKQDIEKVTNVLLEYVHYNYPTINRTLRLKTMKRKVVITVDTDSCFLNLGPYINFINNLLVKNTLVIGKHDKIKNGLLTIAPRTEKDICDKQVTYRILNTILFAVNSMIRNTLDVFLSRCNCSRSHGNTSMKNEFMYDRILLCAPAKKHYQGAIRLQEGLEYSEPKFDVKGMDYMKLSSAGETTRNFIQKFVYNDILTAKTINIPKLLKKLKKFENKISESVISGKDEYIKTANVKTEDAYERPLSIGSYKAVYVWNQLNPDNQIELPGIAKILKVNISKLNDVSELRNTNPEIFNRFSKLFGNQTISKSGITSIAIPLDETPPEWIVPYINLDDIIYNNMNLLLPVLNSIGIKVIYRSKSNQFFSNVINI